MIFVTVGTHEQPFNRLIQGRLQGCTRVSGEWWQVLYGRLCAEEYPV